MCWSDWSVTPFAFIFAQVQSKALSAPRRSSARGPARWPERRCGRYPICASLAAAAKEGPPGAHWPGLLPPPNAFAPSRINDGAFNGYMRGDRLLGSPESVTAAGARGMAAPPPPPPPPRQAKPSRATAGGPQPAAPDPPRPLSHVGGVCVSGGCLCMSPLSPLHPYPLKVWQARMWHHHEELLRSLVSSLVCCANRLLVGPNVASYYLGCCHPGQRAPT